MNDDLSRRKISFRESKFAIGFARKLAKTKVTPNAISIASMGFSFVGMVLAYWYSQEAHTILLFLVAISIQFRLLCNLFDGMVAIEGGKKTPAGELYNELPDRISDTFSILSLGFLVSGEFSEAIVWLSVFLSVLTAYIRLLGVTMNCPQDFSGPMAKQHRMALITAVFLSVGVMRFFNFEQDYIEVLSNVSLNFLFVGLIMTCYRRVMNIFTVKSRT